MNTLTLASLRRGSVLTLALLLGAPARAGDIEDERIAVRTLQGTKYWRDAALN